MMSSISIWLRRKYTRAGGQENTRKANLEVKGGFIDIDLEIS